MKNAWWLGLLVAMPGLAGCAPDGPREFYRSALAARGELVDSLSSIVDEPSAKRVKDFSFKLHDERIKEIQDEIEKQRTRVQPAFRKLQRENFKLSQIEPDDRAAMITGMRSYAAYCKNVVYSNARLARELDRLNMLVKLEMATKARAQIAANQPVNVSAETDAPNLSAVIKGFDKKDGGNRMAFIPSGTRKEQIKLLEAGIDDDDLKLIFEADLSDLTVPAPGLTVPAVPKFPDWALEAGRRANIDMTIRPRQKIAPKAADAPGQ